MVINVVDNIQSKINTLGLRIPEQLQVPPNVKTSTWVRIRGDKSYISGHGPQTHNGFIAGPFGKVGSTAHEISVEQTYQSAKLAGLAILGSLKPKIGTLDKVTAWLQVRVTVNTVPCFTQTANVADGFSDLIILLYDHEIGMHARSAIGVQALPLGLPVVIGTLVEIAVSV